MMSNKPKPSQWCLSVIIGVLPTQMNSFVLQRDFAVGLSKIHSCPPRASRETVISGLIMWRLVEFAEKDESQQFLLCVPRVVPMRQELEGYSTRRTNRPYFSRTSESMKQRSVESERGDGAGDFRMQKGRYVWLVSRRQFLVKFSVRLTKLEKIPSGHRFHISTVRIFPRAEISSIGKLYIRTGEILSARASTWTGTKRKCSWPLWEMTVSNAFAEALISTSLGNEGNVRTTFLNDTPLHHQHARAIIRRAFHFQVMESHTWDFVRTWSHLVKISYFFLPLTLFAFYRSAVEGLKAQWALEDVLNTANTRNELTVGVHKVAEELAEDHCGVALCVLVDDPNTEPGVHVHCRLIEAFCWECFIPVAKVRNWSLSCWVITFISMMCSVVCR